ncbi:MAG: mevalonate kinase [Chloroflexi bacterium]|nr:mevalonate kinase [Chloroflexota bacterium]
MPTTASAPGKIILLGEHAVVYGRPAIAVPVWETVATATIMDLPAGRHCVIAAPDIGLHTSLIETPASFALALVVRLTLARLNLSPDPNWQIEVSSTIPIASGLGSGAALSTALVRAIYAHVGQPVTPTLLSELVFESERLYHGTPSGIDNTVIAYGLPLWFVKGQLPAIFTPRQPFTLAIADSGIAAPTKTTVGDVRQGWQADSVGYERRFDAIARLTWTARQVIEAGDIAELGALFDRNQALLAELGVSSPPLERLIEAAKAAGALGAKLSGGGRGGNVIALVAPEKVMAVQQALMANGAKNVIVTTVKA